MRSKSTITLNFRYATETWKTLYDGVVHSKSGWKAIRVAPTPSMAADVVDYHVTTIPLLKPTSSGLQKGYRGLRGLKDPRTPCNMEFNPPGQLEPTGPLKIYTQRFTSVV